MDYLTVYFLFENHLDTYKRLSKSTKKATVEEEERPRSVSPTRGKRGPPEGLDLKFAFG